ncbi:MAG: glutathione S-transferase, partial [Albidovulum sp.]
ASYLGFIPGAAALGDLSRIETLWARAKGRFGAGGPWLFGRYTVVDAFFAPVATRIATYDLPVSTETLEYVKAHLSDPAFRRWRAMGEAERRIQPSYVRSHPQRAWPGPAPRRAALAEGPSANDACPYCGEPVTAFLEVDGRIWGFCNAFCRDKTLADPEAWPAFMAMVTH